MDHMKAAGGLYGVDWTGVEHEGSRGSIGVERTGVEHKGSRGGVHTGLMGSMIGSHTNIKDWVMRRLSHKHQGLGP